MEAASLKRVSRQGSFSLVQAVIIGFVILALSSLLIYTAQLPSVCITKQAQDLDKEQQLVSLHVIINPLSPPQSVLVGDFFSSNATIVSFSQEPLFINSKDHKITWLFWQGALPLKDTTLSYVVREGESREGFFVTARNAGNLTAGYTRRSLTLGKEVCV